MRTAFIKELFELAKEDQRIVLIVGDLGFGVVTPFMEQLPKQFLNAGVAEQNMTGMAAGMALSGKIALTYSIANFPTLRCLEHVRNDVCYHNANVKIVSVGGGFTYGAMGATQHAVEDIAVMRALAGSAAPSRKSWQRRTGSRFPLRGSAFLLRSLLTSAARNTCRSATG